MKLKHIIKNIVVVGLLSAVSQTAEASADANMMTFSGELRGERYSTEVKGSFLTASSMLDLNTDSPRVNPSDAARLARGGLLKAFGNQVENLMVSSVSLDRMANTDQWFWSVSFSSTPRPTSYDRLVVVVLFDGSLILPAREKGQSY